MSYDELPSVRYWDAREVQWGEFDQQSTARFAGQDGCVIHPAASRADELLAIGQDFHQLGDRWFYAVGTQQCNRKAREQGRR